MIGYILLAVGGSCLLFWMVERVFGLRPANIQPLEKLEDVMYRYDTHKLSSKVTMIPGDILHLTVNGTKLDFEPDRCWTFDTALEVHSNEGTFWFISDGEHIAPMELVQ